MDIEKLKDNMNSLQEQGIEFYNNKEHQQAFKCLYKAYKIGNKIGKILKNTRRYLDYVCFELGQSLYNEAVDLYNNEKYAKAGSKLSAAKKVLVLGVKLDRFYREDDCQKLLDDLKEFVKENKTAKHEKFKDSVSDFFEGVGDFVDSVLDSGSQTSSNGNQEYEEEEELSSAQRYALHKAQEHYDFGLNYGPSLLAFDHFKKCYELAKEHDLTEMKDKAAMQIGRCYADFANEEEKQGYSCLYSQLYKNAEEHFTEAKEYYEAANRWLPDSCDFSYNYEISQMKEQIDYAYREYLYED